VGHEDLQADYDLAGFGNRLGFGDRPALIVIDFVTAYLNRESALYAGVEHTVVPAKRVLEAARVAEIPVIYTQVVYADDGRDGGLFFRKVGALRSFVGESAEGEVISELAPLPGELIVRKQYASAFFGTSLDSSLRTAGVDTVILIGLSTSGCVRATGVDAIQLGFRPIVVADAVGDRDERPHRASLFDLAAKYADVLSADEVIAHLESRSSR
jgi:maleamate amidohydrolase